MSRLDRIASDPEVCHGKPVIRGLRYPVADILQLLAGGISVEEVLTDYPDLERDDVLAAVEYGLTALESAGMVELGQDSVEVFEQPDL